MRAIYGECNRDKYLPVKIVISTSVYLRLDQSVEGLPTLNSQSCQASDCHGRKMFHKYWTRYVSCSGSLKLGIFGYQ